MVHSFKLLSSVLLFSLFVNNTLFAQGVTIKISNQPLSEVLEKISKDYEVKVAYDSDLASGVIVSGNFVNSTLEQVIRELILGKPLELLIINDVYVVRPISVVDKEMEEVVVIQPVEHKILGLVLDKATGEHLPYATVSVLGTSTGVSANADGYFTLFTKQSDSLTLRVSFLGFIPKDIRVHPPSLMNKLDVYLDQQQMLITEAILTRRQPDIVTTDPAPGMLRWNSNRNTDIPSLNGLDIAAPLQLLPGIDGTTESLSGLIVRKLPSDMNLFVFDGFTIYHIDHFFGAFTSFNSKSVKDIRVFKSGFDAQWGGRASSVIEITGKTGNQNKIVVDAGLDLLSADVMIEGPINDRLTFLISGRRSFTDIFRSRIYYQLLESARSDIVNSTRTYPSFFRVDADEPSYMYYDLNTKLSFKPNSRDNLSLSLFLGSDAMELNRKNENQMLTEDSGWGSNGLGFRWSRQWNQSFSHTLTIGTSKYYLDFLHTDTTLRVRQNSSITDTVKRSSFIYNRLNDLNVNYTNSVKLNGNNQFEFGLQTNGVKVGLEESLVHYVNRFSVIDTIRDRSQGMLVSTIWGQHILSYKRLKSFKIGLRVNYYSPTKELYTEPRAQLSFSIAPNAYLKFSAGRYYQFVNQILTISSNGFRRIWTVADGGRFPVVSSYHFTAGILARLPKNFSIDIEAYRRTTRGMASIHTVLRRSESGTGIKEQQVLITADNNTNGVDVMFHKQMKNAQFWMAYTYAKSENISDKMNAGEPYPSLVDQRNELKLAWLGKLKGFSLSCTYIYGSGKPWDELVFTNTLQLSDDYQKNANRLPPYNRIDLGLSYTHNFKAFDVKGGVNLFNVFNWENTLSTVYLMSDTPYLAYLQTGSPLIYNDLNGMGFASSLYLNIKF
jgi:ferric enterobactin receptor